MTTQEHLLIKLMEECAEVSQRASKALRFGMSETQSGQDLNNRQRLEGEFADLLAVFEMMKDRKMVESPLPELMPARKLRVEKYLKYSREIGTLKD